VVELTILRASDYTIVIILDPEEKPGKKKKSQRKLTKGNKN